MILRILLYISLMLLGFIVGRKGNLGKALIKKLDSIQLVCLLFLLFIMGVSMGIDPNVMSSFSFLGFKGIIFASFSIIFSVFFIFIMNKILLLFKKEDNYLEGRRKLDA